MWSKSSSEKKRPFLSCCRAKVTAKLSNGRRCTAGVNVSSADSGVKVPLSRPPKRRRGSLTEAELAQNDIARGVKDLYQSVEQGGANEAVIFHGT